MSSVVGRVAKVIEPYISSDFRRAERAFGAAEDLQRSGLLAGQQPTTRVVPKEAAANLLQCRFSWPDAEKIAAELADRDLLAMVTAPNPTRCPGSIVLSQNGPPAYCGSTRAHAAHDLTEGDAGS